MEYQVKKSFYSITQIWTWEYQVSNLDAKRIESRNPSRHRSHVGKRPETSNLTRQDALTPTVISLLLMSSPVFIINHHHHHLLLTIVTMISAYDHLPPTPPKVFFLPFSQKPDGFINSRRRKIVCQEQDFISKIRILDQWEAHKLSLSHWHQN